MGEPVYIIDEEAEKREIARRYRSLLRACRRATSPMDRAIIRKAFDVAVQAHSSDRRKTGEPYIYHPIAVAKIVAEEIGLDTTSIVAALLHDTVEDTYITLDDIENLFGKKERSLIDGLTKIEGVLDHSSSIQAENFRKMILTLSDDVRVILIKVADRLHNMRTLDSMKREKQLKIASETMYMYAPLAHRLGLYTIKTELEDLSLKYKEAEAYQDIVEQLKRSQAGRTRFINKFSKPIIKDLDKAKIPYELKGRTKSVFSIWTKMKKKNIPFDEVYDVFAIRIIIESDNLETEKNLCWNAYSMVTDHYRPNTERLRDWVSTPKSNGYESLHATVMSDVGRWVEVQIRSRRMDTVAERGLAAHWKYKEGEQASESSLDKWLRQVRELLENPDADALNFIDDFKLNLFAEEIYVFTPTGDLKKLPVGATALDFAFEIHTEVGEKCIGSRVNHRLVPLSHPLKSGDQVEIITGKNQKPNEDWLNFVITGKAKSKIRESLKEKKKLIASDGKEMLQRKLRGLKVDFLSITIDTLIKNYKQDSALDLYYNIAIGKIDLKKMKGYEVENGRFTFEKKKRKTESSTTPDSVNTDPTPNKHDTLILSDNNINLKYSLGQCCSPIPGDDIFGFVTISDGIKIHRMNCPNATQMLSKFDYRVMKAMWSSQKEKEFLSYIRFEGIDDIGLVHKITDTISGQLHINMRSISFESNDGIFAGKIALFIHSTSHLNKLIAEMKNISGVTTVERIEVFKEDS
jgi:GTP diphosphokinase / guanosine-3',5'-bis(diphosphate) 3'-diphosphatase